MKWWEDNISEELTVVGLVAIALAALWVLGADAKEIAIAIGGGLVGYLKGRVGPIK